LTAGPAALSFGHLNDRLGSEHGALVETAGASGKLIVLSGKGKEELALTLQLPKHGRKTESQNCEGCKGGGDHHRAWPRCRHGALYLEAKRTGLKNGPPIGLYPAIPAPD
jgi:hypothetical protein